MLFVKGYKEELKSYVITNKALFQRFQGKRILVSGAAGMIGSYVLDLLIVANELLSTEIRTLAVDNNSDRLIQRFPETIPFLSRIVCDVNDGVSFDGKVDYVIHAASNTSPLDYANMPVATMRTNMVGTDNMIKFAIISEAKRFLFCSSVEAYGMNNGDVDLFDEEYCGYINSNTLRAGYPSAKRASEALLNAYTAENQSFDFVVARIGRIYGPTVILGDTKAPTQFIMDAVHGRDIVMKSPGNQELSFAYVGDCSIALLKLLNDGVSGNAYNVADPESTVQLRDFAYIAANTARTVITFEQMSEKEEQAYSKVNKAKMDIQKLQKLGWCAECHLQEGVTKTISYLRELLNT